MEEKDPIDLIERFICCHLKPDSSLLDEAVELAKAYMGMGRLGPGRRTDAPAAGTETFELVEALEGRAGVQVTRIAPTATATIEVAGPATVLEIID